MASAPVSLGDLDQALGDQRPGDRGAEQIDALIEGVGAEHREDEVADELLAQILDVDLLDAEHLGLAARRLQLLALAEIGGEGHHLAAVGRLQPFQDDRGVEPAGIGEHDLLDAFSHEKSLEPRRPAEIARDYRAATRLCKWRPRASHMELKPTSPCLFDRSETKPRRT